MARTGRSTDRTTPGRLVGQAARTAWRGVFGRDWLPPAPRSRFDPRHQRRLHLRGIGCPRVGKHPGDRRNPYPGGGNPLSIAHGRGGERETPRVPGGRSPVGMDCRSDFQTVTVHRPGAPPELFNITQQLSGKPHLPGFVVPVAKIFAPDPHASPGGRRLNRDLPHARRLLVARPRADAARPDRDQPQHRLLRPAAAAGLRARHRAAPPAGRGADGLPPPPVAAAAVAGPRAAGRTSSAATRGGWSSPPTSPPPSTSSPRRCAWPRPAKSC